MSHGKHNDKLQIQDQLSEHGKYCDYESHTPIRSGDTNNETKGVDLTLGCPILAGTVILASSHASAQIKVSLNPSAHLVSKKCHTLLFCFA